ncbi:flagellar filament capping protein FliD [Vibrio sp. Isolate25]|uniref:flagellar filament capping protein FliD n=1 Tax=Vibrio TaxID=662 RepID=UPI001EFD2FF0|nr:MULTISPECIES: flagellar filament capping protein FliD [Vibrio]MCG9598101.1 flagellar filament capping protein FliD [Vibrio sp. Isolate25]MCG9679522.1 flagellar filament capping protein FliD [Vibrio sp. Isolate24]MCG9683581.1 flagellar filament capping protein FliD [Vibrio sp. Isolate23]USD33248.1 flagellar filament capping protein FliD [Vibrio sp. SCSIO 43186]USD46318.1 flagellar filament capping protein FliD [Vibrio sp. SCSIO 43145]
MSFGPVGMNSGMDINAMVSKIVDSERVPKQQRIDNERDKIDSSISAYGRLRESLDTMKNLMASFRQEKAFAARKVESTDDTVVSATATTEAIAGRYAIDVLQLAQSHKIASDVLPEDAKFGPGKLQISLGDKKFTIEVQENSKLIDIVRGINGSKTNPGVRASVINDVEGPRLIVASSNSGEQNALKLSVESAPDNLLKRLEYKTLEQRVKDLEQARAAAQDLLKPLTPEEQEIADRIAENNVKAAKVVDQEIADSSKQAAIAADPNAAKDASAGNELSDAAAAAAAAAGAEANKYLKPEERIPGWTATASGTLLDSYWEPEPQLDAKALEKAPDIPGWSITASGTLTDSYVTPKEAQAALDARQAEIENKLAQEKAALEAKVLAGELTPEQAKELERAKLPKEEREYLERIDQAQADLKSAQESFDAYRGMTQVQAAQDSKVLLDGVAQLSSDNNIIEDAIEGVDLTLKGRSERGKTPSEIDIEYDRQGVRDDIEQFVAAYNQFYQVSQELSGVDPRTGAAGPLAGDSVVRSADSRLKSVFSSDVEPAPDDLKTLTEFGITTTRQGTLEINYEMLDRQLNNNFNKLEDFFGGNQGFAKKVEDAIQGITGVTGSIRTRERSMVEQNYRLEDDQASLDRRMESLEKRTHAKFTAMQDATSKMQSQLAGMMNALGG